MSELYRPILAPLPLLLWKTPPGLELILAQEGIAHEVIRDPHPYAFRRGRFVLFDSETSSPSALRQHLTHNHVIIDINTLRRDQAVDPFAAIVDHQDARGVWKHGQWTLAERVARYPKAWIRRRLIQAIRERILAEGGLWIRISPFPHPYRSVFNFRVDLDEPFPDDYHRFAITRNLLSDCTTHFVSTHAYADLPTVLGDLHRHDTQSHGHFHYIYRDPESNLRNLERADRLLREAGFAPTGFAAPHGRWNPGLDDAIESLDYRYSTDFQLGYDDLPFFPWKNGRFSRVVQLPVHPVCEGLFLDAGVTDRRVIEQYLTRIVAAKIEAGEPALVYGHPERRLGRMPEILIALHRLLEQYDLVWRATMTELAEWWHWRSSRKFMVLPMGSAGFEIQFEEWDSAYPLSIEIDRGDFHGVLPLTKARTLVRTDDLVFERKETGTGQAVVPPEIDPRPASFKDAVRRALDWETVTPIHELPSSSFSGRLKKGLRWWKQQRTGTGG